MQISFEQYEQLQDYLDGVLELKEMKSFEDQLKTDTVLNEHYLFEKEMRKNLNAIEEGTNSLHYKREENALSSLDEPSYVRNMIELAGKSFKLPNNNPGADQIDTFSQVTDPPRSAKVIFNTVWIKLSVAACLLFIVAGITWYSFNKSVTHDIVKNNKDNSGIAILFQQFFHKDEVPDHKPLLLASALEDYSNDSYESLQNINIDNLPVSKGVGDSFDADQRVRELGYYYKGMSHLMKNGIVQEAITNLQWVTDSTLDKPLKIKAGWYLALAYVKNNDPQKATTILQRLASDKNGGIYNKNARELLGKLAKTH